MENNSIPMQVMQQYRDVILSADVMKVTVVSTILCHSTNTHYGPYEDRVRVTGHVHLDQPNRDLLGLLMIRIKGNNQCSKS